MIDKNDRDKAVIEAYNRVVSRLGEKAKMLRRSEIVSLVVKEPAPRLYVSTDRAWKVVSAYVKDPNFLNSVRSHETKKMYCYILCVVALLAERGIPLQVATNAAVCSPAPSFFLSERTVRENILNARLRRNKTL